MLLALAAPAQVRLVADLNPGMGPEGSTLPARASAPGITWVVAQDANAGPSLWRTDGSVGGTRQIQRFFPAISPPTYPQPLAALDGVLLFAASDAAHGYELWRSDGTPQGTWMVADLLPGPLGSLAGPFFQATRWRGAAWFHAARSPDRASLWRSDGTRAGTMRVLDFEDWGLGELTTTETHVFLVHNGQLVATDGTAAGTATLHTDAWRLQSDGERVWFYGLDASHVLQLWRSDGTVAGTRPVVVPSRHADVPRLAFWQGSTWFSSDVGLWRVDSTGTRPQQVHPTLWPLFLTPLANRLLFIANGPFLATAWATDGTSAGTVPLAATTTGLVRFGERALFLNGTALRVTDGTVAGTRTVVDLAPGSIYSLTDTQLAGRAFFVAERSGEGRELWVTDGTPAGTHLVRDIRPGPQGSAPADFSVENGLLLFTADDGVTGRELWRSDGTAAGTFLLRNIATAAPLSSLPTQLVGGAGLQRGVFFRPWQSREHAGRLWFSDGTATGTRVLPVSISNARGETPLAVRDGVACFGVFAYPIGTTLWRSDGTVAGTVPIGRLGYSLFDVKAGERSFWLLEQGGPGLRLWRSDGTAAGTTAVSGWSQSAPAPRLWVQPTAATGERVWILGAAKPATGVEPWLSDGTATGTRLLLDIAPGPDSSDPAEPTLRGDTVFFTADDHVHGRELWRSDGTAAGTRLVADVRSGASGSGPRLLTPVADRLYFLADDGVHGEELWCTDTTPAGAHLVRDVRPGPAGGSAELLTALGDRLLFAASDEVHGCELWVSEDATAAGTRLLADLAPQGASGMPAAYGFLLPVPGARFALFAATDGVRPLMLWRTDGTPEWTRLWDDVAVGSRAFGPQPVVSGNQVFLIADDGTSGMELFVAPSPAAAVTVGHGCAAAAAPPALRAAGLPTLGNRGFGVDLESMPPDVDAALVLGDPGALALSPGCVLRVAPPFAAALVTRTSASGRARVVLPVPNDPSLAGLQLVAQAAAAAPSLVLSPGLRLVLARE